MRLCPASGQWGYNASTNAEYMESAKKQMGMIQAVLAGTRSTLLVAAIGIANTMMMSIYERTKKSESSRYWDAV